MPRDPRRFKGRAQIDLGAMFGAMGGGDIIPMEPGEVDFNDATFDANTQTRFKPKSGFKDFISGGQASAAANDINNAQILSDQDFSNKMRRAPELMKLDVERERQLKDVGVKSAIEQAKQLDALKYNTGVNRLARANVNESFLNDPEAAFNPDIFYGENDDKLLPASARVKAASSYAKFGDMVDKIGDVGAITGNDASLANTAHQRKLTEMMGKKERQMLNDGSYVDGDKLFRWNEPSIDAEGNPRPGYYTPFDLKVGLPIGDKQTATPAPAPAPVSSARGVITPDRLQASEPIVDADLTDYNLYRLLNNDETLEEYSARKRAKKETRDKQQRYIMKPY